jgi:hypothetical protein
MRQVLSRGWDVMGATPAITDRYVQERKAAAQTLRAETAQVLGLVVVEIAALLKIDDEAEVHARLSALRAAVRVEIARVAHLADVLERAP